MANEDHNKEICDLYNALYKLKNDTEEADTNISDEDKIKYILDNLDYLFTLDFWSFAKRYKNDDIDGDHEVICSPVYWLLWGDKLKKKIDSNYKYRNFDQDITDDPLPNCKFGGDTICTFNTLFGSDSIKWFEKKVDDTQKPKRLTCFTNEELEDINNFRKLYQSLGNFYILPKNTIKVGKEYKSINTFRGDISNWKDYFDTFLLNLDKELRGEIVDNTFHELMKLNAFFFGKGKVDSIDKFIEFFNLEDFKYYKFKDHLTQNDYETNKDAYHDFALDYIRISTDCIKARVEKLKQILKAKLENM